MAISSRGGGSKTWRIGEGGSCWSSWSSQAMPPPGKWILVCRMTRWRRSAGEGSIYRTKRAGANLTYLFAASVKSEGVQLDMVTVRTVIKGLRRWFDDKRSWFWRYFTMQDRLVGPSAVLSNGNIADERVSGEIRLRGWEIRGICRRVWPRLFRFGSWLPDWGKVIVERHHYCKKICSINDFILWNWGACVDTVFGHVSFDAHLGLMGCRSADGAVVTSL